MSAQQEALFETPEEERARAQRDEWQNHRAYLDSIDRCPFCGKAESNIGGFINGHGYLSGWPRYANGAGCSRLYLLGNQAVAYARAGDIHKAEDRWADITWYQEDATDWPSEWFAGIEAKLRESGALA